MRQPTTRIPFLTDRATHEAITRRRQVAPLIIVARGELTCLRCGETIIPALVADGRLTCPRCQDEEDDQSADSPQAVPTVAYLRANEYAYTR